MTGIKLTEPQDDIKRNTFGLRLKLSNSHLEDFCIWLKQSHFLQRYTAKYIPILSALKPNLPEVHSCPEFTYRLYLNSSNS